MKIQQYIKRLPMIAALLAPATFVTAQQEWKADGSETITGDVVINLTEDITVKGVTHIGGAYSGGQLGTSANVTINNASDKEIKVTRDASYTDGGFFVLHAGSTLTIRGSEGQEIVFDGGAEFKWDDTGGKDDEWKLDTSQRPSTQSMFATNGNLTLEYVKIQNYYTTTDNRSAITVAENQEPCGTTALKHCTIEMCRAPFGPALYCHTNQAPKNSDGTKVNEWAKENTPEKCPITIENTTIQKCVCYTQLNENRDNDGEWWGGAIRFRGRCVSNVTMTNCTMQYNYSRGDGSCIWWNQGGGGENMRPVLTLDGCTFQNNKAYRDAGAVRLEATFTFSGEKTVFQNNYAGRHGGAIQIAAYNGGSDKFSVKECIYHLASPLEVKNNEAKENGGGISFWFATNDLEKRTAFSLWLEGMDVHDNTAGNNGGGIAMEESTDPDYAYVFNVYNKSGKVWKNEAGKNGGGIYIDNMIVEGRSDENERIEVNDNTAKNGNGGGICLETGKMTIKTALIQNNTANGTDITTGGEIGRGGGIYVKDGTFSIEGSANITGNTSGSYGGGIYVNNIENREHQEGDPIDHSVTLSGGTITGNHGGHAGGGICLYGHVDATVSGVTIQNNDASNAGGILLKGYGESAEDAKRPTMKYSSGRITGNHATGTSESLKSGYGISVEKMYGVGGGIVVGTYSEMSFDVTTQGPATGVGIYNNLAEMAADDVACAGSVGEEGKIVELPDVSKMQLDGFAEAKKYTLYWVEDYFTNDPNYDKGTKKKPDWDSVRKNGRYRDEKKKDEKNTELRAVSEIYGITPQEVKEASYVCATLGWKADPNYIILEKEGLEDRDNAIFEVFKGSGPDMVKVMTVILTAADKEEDGVRRKIILLDTGTWTVTEDSKWSWAYTTSPSQQTRSVGSTTSDEGRTFTFKNTLRENIPNHAESVKVNDMPSRATP